MRVVWSTFDKKLGGEMKSANGNYFKGSLKAFQNLLLFREIYVKYLEKNSL